jgi:hypothetical protein
MLIGLCGRPQSGKTEVRRILEHDFGFKTVCSKQLLYSFSSLVTNLPAEKFYKQEYKNETFRGRTHRQITGTIGNAIEELFGDSYLVDRSVADLDLSAGNYVVDSLRKGQTNNFRGWVVEVVSDRGFDTGNSFDLYDRENINIQLRNNSNFSELEYRVEDMIEHLDTSDMKTNSHRLIR